MSNLKNRLKVLKEITFKTYNQFLDDKGFKMAAALSYYAAFSLGPLLIICISIAGFIFGEEAVRGELSSQITYLIGKEGAEMVEIIIKGASNLTTGFIAGIISLIFLVLGSLGVFIELQESLNIIWGVEPKPGRGIWGFLKTRVTSLSMVIATGFLMMISLIVNTIISLIYNIFDEYLGSFLPVTEIINLVSSFIIITLLFAFIFKYLPDVIISWKYVWIGALITSILFSFGKYLIGIYLGNSSYSSTYGAAASFIILFIWIYYSGIILFFGAEFTQVYRSRNTKSKIKPDADGIIVPKVSELIKRSMEESLSKNINK